MGRCATPMTSRWMVDTVAWLLNDVGRKCRGNRCGTVTADRPLRSSCKVLHIDAGSLKCSDSELWDADVSAGNEARQPPKYRRGDCL